MLITIHNDRMSNVHGVVLNLQQNGFMVIAYLIFIITCKYTLFYKDLALVNCWY